MADLQDTIIEALEADPERQATPTELRARVNALGVDTSRDRIAEACDDLVRAGDLHVVGEREDSTLYELVREP